jgi:hypothetical protein
VPETLKKPVIAFAPPLDQTPTFPSMTLAGTLVTVVAPRTVKLAKSEPRIGVAHAGVTPESAPITANEKVDKCIGVFITVTPNSESEGIVARSFGCE